MIFRRNRFALKHRKGEIRIVRKFAWLPRSFNTGKWVWLQWVYVKELIEAVDIGGSCEWGRYKYCWIEQRFATRAEYLSGLE